MTRTATISALRGKMHRLDDGTPLFVTVHPSYLLRIQAEADKAQAYRDFVADLRLARDSSEQKLAHPGNGDGGRHRKATAR
jgi:uracil-DNA glycosylase